MLPQLNDIEARLIGCLMEKSVTTPDQYPLTLNGLTNACNQKSSREPVMALNQAQVQRAARGLQGKSFLHIDENFKTGAEKYKQRLCNTHFSDLKFDAPQFAIVCLLLLRGPQTPGELRARSGRLHAFTDNAAVTAALATLAGEDDEPLVVKLPRTPGRKDSEYMHQLCGPLDLAAYASKANAARTGGSAERIAELIQQVSELEAQVSRLKAELATRG
ncbi:MAG: DUF480 domain-containing protein [Salinisphaera sp.]|nr:DUF480 domain-containing protein [Salinisphaera sp.]